MTTLWIKISDFVPDVTLDRLTQTRRHQEPSEIIIWSDIVKVRYLCTSTVKVMKWANQV